MADLRVRLLDLATRIATEFKTIRTEITNGLAGKQATLVSGTNIKTINSQSLLGSGDIPIVGAGGDIKSDGTVAFTASQSMGNHKITNLLDGSLDADAINFRQLRDVFYQVDAVDTVSNRNSSTLIVGAVVDTNMTLVAGNKVLLANNSAQYSVYQVAVSGPPTNIGQPKICYTFNGVGNQAKYYILDVDGQKYSELFVPFTRIIEKTTPAGTDGFEIYDTANSNYKKKITFTSFLTYLNGVYQQISLKNTASGYAGLSATFQLQLRNIGNTFTSLLQNSNTGVRTYTLQDRNGTLADDTDITGAKARANHTGTQLASTISDFNTAALAAVSTGAPALLDTLDELAAALGDDPNFATTMTTALGNRVRYDAAQTLTAPQKTQACTNIGIGEPDTDFVSTFNAALI